MNRFQPSRSPEPRLILASAWSRVTSSLSSRLALSLALSLTSIGCQDPDGARLQFAISFPEVRSAESQDGRVLLYISKNDISKNDDAEPRFQVGNGLETQLVFGVDAEGLAPGEEAVIDVGVFGYPLESLADIPPGDYWIQALLNRYETFHLSDGRVLKLPPDKGEGQHLERKPGNFYSTPERVRIDPGENETIRISMDQEVPPIVPPEDTKYVKHIRMQSDLLSEFWGRPTYLGAHVLLPEGFDEHPEARYPLAISHGHFPADFGGFREDPPDPATIPSPTGSVRPGRAVGRRWAK